MRAGLTSAVIALSIGWLAPVCANEVSRAKAKEAIAVCTEVDRMPARDRQKRLARLAEGVVIAEAAVKADDGDARAHLALGCNLGQQLDISGLSWRVFAQLRRVQAEFDKALELAPADPDVLCAKAEMLRRTPGPLGGNKNVAHALLRRAVSLYPEHVTARLYLARAMAEDHAPNARATIYEALAVAKKQGAEHEQSEAQELLASLED